MTPQLRLTGLNALVVLSSVGVSAAIWLGSELALLLAVLNVLVSTLSLLAPAEPKQPESVRANLGSGSYEILDKLGEGGMGEVFRARQVGLARLVALKRIKPVNVSKEGRSRFRREARVLSSLFNPHTINVFDAGIQKDGSFFYVMELLDGFNLQEVVEVRKTLPPARVIHILRQATMSLAEAHGRGLVHRDLKPANLMVCRYGGENDFVKVLDFGLVKVGQGNGDAPTAITNDDALPGTPAFLAPESILGSGFVDARADIYSLGALGHYLLTGRYLFDADTPMKMVQAQLHEAPTRPSQVAPQEVPPQLDDLLYRCLQKDPKERPQSADELLIELEQLSLAHPWTREMAAQCFADVPSPSIRPEPPLPSELTSGSFGASGVTS